MATATNNLAVFPHHLRAYRICVCPIGMAQWSYLWPSLLGPSLSQNGTHRWEVVKWMMWLGVSHCVVATGALHQCPQCSMRLVTLAVVMLLVHWLLMKVISITLFWLFDSEVSSCLLMANKSF